jgi:hypothetical protein
MRKRPSASVVALLLPEAVAFSDVKAIRTSGIGSPVTRFFTTPSTVAERTFV